jgi:hypothetical protein
MASQADLGSCQAVQQLRPAATTAAEVQCEDARLVASAPPLLSVSTRLVVQPLQQVHHLLGDHARPGRQGVVGVSHIVCGQHGARTSVE